MNPLVLYILAISTYNYTHISIASHCTIHVHVLVVTCVSFSKQTKCLSFFYTVNCFYI